MTAEGSAEREGGAREHSSGRSPACVCLLPACRSTHPSAVPAGAPACGWRRLTCGRGPRCTGRASPHVPEASPVRWALRPCRWSGCPHTRQSGLARHLARPAMPGMEVKPGLAVLPVHPCDLLCGLRPSVPHPPLQAAEYTELQRSAQWLLGRGSCERLLLLAQSLGPRLPYGQLGGIPSTAQRRDEQGWSPRCNTVPSGGSGRTRCAGLRAPGPEPSVALESSRPQWAHLPPARVGAVGLDLVHALLVAGHLAHWEVMVGWGGGAGWSQAEHQGPRLP